MAVTVFFADGRVEAFPEAGMALRQGAVFRVYEAGPPNREKVRTFPAWEIVRAEVSGRLNYSVRGTGDEPLAASAAGG